MSEPSVNSKVRLLGEVGTTEKPSLSLTPRTPAQSAAPPVSITPPPSPAPVPAEPIFLGNSADGADLLNAGQIVQPLAQLCVTPQVQTPFLAAILGPSGAGKTFALRRFAQAIEQLGVSSATAGGGVLQRVVLARVDASNRVEAPVAIASAAYAALDREPGGVDYSGLLDETGHAGGDPHRAARAASDRHDDLVRKLETERTQRDEIEARRARIADTLAFDTPGSRLDVFARARRGTIEAQLRRFGFAGADVNSSYRSLARDISTLGAGGRAAVVIRSIWAYGSQSRLILWAIVAFVLGFLIRLLHSDAAVAAVGAPTTGSSRSRAGSPRTATGSTGRRRSCISSARWRSRSTCGARFSSPTFSCAARGCSLPRSANDARTSTRDRPGSISASPR